MLLSEGHQHEDRASALTVCRGWRLLPPCYFGVPLKDSPRSSVPPLDPFHDHNCQLRRDFAVSVPETYRTAASGSALAPLKQRHSIDCVSAVKCEQGVLAAEVYETLDMTGSSGWRPTAALPGARTR